MGITNILNGVSVLLTKKKVTLKEGGKVITIFMLENFFKVNTPLKTLNSKNIIITSSSFYKSKNSMNLNIVQRKRKTNLLKSKFSRLGGKTKTSWFFWKFKYHGKGLKIKKSTKDQSILFNLGNSHVSRLYFDNTNLAIKRTKKNSYTVLSLNSKNVIKKENMKLIRPYNKYTRRGLRLAKQPISRRFGKVSQILPRKK